MPGPINHTDRSVSGLRKFFSICMEIASEDVIPIYRALLPRKKALSFDQGTMTPPSPRARPGPVVQDGDCCSAEGGGRWVNAAADWIKIMEYVAYKVSEKQTEMMNCSREFREWEDNGYRHRSPATHPAMTCRCCAFPPCKCIRKSQRIVCIFCCFKSNCNRNK